jgi:hypothetical protein
MFENPSTREEPTVVPLAQPAGVPQKQEQSSSERSQPKENLEGQKEAGRAVEAKEEVVAKTAEQDGGEEREEPRGMFWVDSDGQASYGMPTEKKSGASYSRGRNAGTVASAGAKKSLPPLSEFLQAARRQKRIGQRGGRGRGVGHGAGRRGNDARGRGTSAATTVHDPLNMDMDTERGVAEVGAWSVGIEADQSSIVGDGYAGDGTGELKEDHNAGAQSTGGRNRGRDGGGDGGGDGSISEYADYVHDQIDQALENEEEQQVYLQMKLQQEHEKQLLLQTKMARESAAHERGAGSTREEAAAALSKSTSSALVRPHPASAAPALSKSTPAPHHAYGMETAPSATRVTARAATAAAAVLAPPQVPMRNIACTCIRHQLQQFLANPSDPKYANLGDGDGGGAMRITKMTALARFLAVQRPECLGSYSLPTDIPAELQGQEEELVLIQDDFGRQLFGQLEGVFGTSAEYVQIGITAELAASFAAAELVRAPFAGTAAPRR